MANTDYTAEYVEYLKSKLDNLANFGIYDKIKSAMLDAKLATADELLDMDRTETLTLFAQNYMALTIKSNAYIIDLNKANVTDPDTYNEQISLRFVKNSDVEAYNNLVQNVTI